MKRLPDKKKFIAIGGAAKILGVSIDTLRRWEKQGTIQAVRIGNKRYFSAIDLEKINSSKPFSISEAAKYLSLSEWTLRRLDQKEILTASRNKLGERIYTKDTLEAFLNSGYFSRQKETLTEEVDNFSVVPDNQSFLKNLFLLAPLLILFFVSFFIAGVDDSKPVVNEKSVLAIKDQANKTSPDQSFFEKIIKPLNGLFAQNINPVNSPIYNIISPKKVIYDVNGIFAFDKAGNLLSRFKLTFPKSSYLVIPDQDVVTNLNADYLRGKKPGSDSGDLAVFGNGNTIVGLTVGAGQITGAIQGIQLADGTVTASNLADSSITSAKLSDGTIATADLGDGLITTVKIADGAVTSAKISDGTIATGDIADSAVTSAKISDGTITTSDIENNTITSSDIAATVTLSDGDFLDFSAITHDDSAVQGLRLPNTSDSPTSPTSGEGYIAWDTVNDQILVYDGSSWGALSGGGGSGDITSVTAGDGLSGGGTTGAVTLTLATTTAGAGLTYSSGVLAVGAGTGISVAADSISASLGTSIDTTEIDADTITLSNVADSLTLDGANLTFASSDSTNDYKIVFDNSSTGDVATLLQITTSGTGATIGTAIDLSDADIATALALGSNDVTVGGATISSTEFALLDSGIALSELTDSGTLTATTVDINGGAIDGVTIGGSSAGAGTFTTLTSTGTTNIGNSTGAVTIDSTGTITLNDATLSLANQATDLDIKDNTASALTISQGTNNYLLITTTDNSEVVTLDLPAGGVTSLTGNLFTSNIAKTINLGTGTAADTIHIGEGGTNANTITIGSDAVANTITIGSSSSTGVSITDNNWSVTTGGAAAFASVTEGGTGLSSKYAPIGADFITVAANGTLTGETAISALTAAISTTSTLNVDSSSTLNALTIDANANFAMSDGTGTFAQTFSPAGTTATANGLTITPKFTLNAADQTLSTIYINPNTNSNNDSGDILYGLNIDNITGSTAVETAIRVGTGWDTGIDANAMTIVNIGNSGTDFDTSGGLTLASTLTLSNNTITCTACIDVTDIGANAVDDSELADTISYTGALTIATSALAVNSDSITADGLTLTINAGGTVNIQDNLTVDSDLTVTGGDVTGSNAETIDIGEADNGSIIFAAAGETNNESIEFDFETTANAMSIFSSTGVTVVDWGSIGADYDSATVTLSTVAGAIDAGGATSLEVPNAAAPTVDAFGEIAGDNDYFAAGRGSLLFYDGTSTTFIPAVLSTDTCTNGQTVKWNTGGTWTCENDNNSGGATAWDAIADPSTGTDIAMNELAQTLDWNTAATAAAFDGLTITITNDATSDSSTQRAFVVQNKNDGAATGTTETLIAIDNADANEAVTNGLLITSSGAGGITNGININDTDVTTDISLQNGETIDNNTDGVIAFSGQILSASSGVEFTESDSNPTCGAGNYTIYADTSETKLKKCVNGVATDLDTTGGVQDVVYVTDPNDTTWAANDTTALSTTAAITPTDANSEILVMVSVSITFNTANEIIDRAIARVDRETTTASCDDVNTVGVPFGALNSDASAPTDIVASYVFVDAPASTSSQSYIICTSANSSLGAVAETETNTEITLMDVNDSADLAEIYPTFDETLLPGEVVSLDPVMKVGVKRAEKAYQKDVLGVVSTNPAMVIGSRGGEGVTGLPIALSGRVPVKVTGVIKKGDILTSSSTPGVAMKAIKAGPIIGIALGDFNGEGVGSVMTFVKTGYFNGGNLAQLIKEPSGDFGRDVLDYLVQDKANIQDGSMDLSEIFTDRIAAGLEVITPRVIADEIIAKTIKAERIEGIDVLVGNIAQLSDQFKSFEDFFSVSTSAQASPSTELVSSTTLPNVLGAQTLAGLDVSGSATISASLRVKGNSLIEGIQTVIDTLMTNNFIVNGASDFFGRAIFRNDVEVKGKLVLGKDSAGVAKIVKGSDKVEVKFEKEYENKPVINISIQFDEDQTALEDAVLGGDLKYIISKRSKSGFVIRLSKVAPEDVNFSWAAVSGGSNILPAESSSEITITPIPTLEPQTTEIPSGTPVPAQ